MKHPKLSAVSLAAALVMFPIVGCEKMENSSQQADRKVDEALVAAQQDKEQGGKAADKALADLKTAAGVSDASPIGQAMGKSALARDEFERALARMPDIAQRTQEIEIALWGLQSAGAQIQATQATAANYLKLEPKEALDQVEQSRGEIKKAVDKAKADADAAKAEIDKRQKEIDDLKSQRTGAENEAEQLSQKSAEAKGKESVDLFSKSTEARIKAGTLAAQIESKTAALMPFQRTLAIAEQQQQFWDGQNKDNPGAMQQLDERKNQIQTGWQSTQSDAQGIADLGKKIAADVLTPKSVNNHDNAGARLVKLVKEKNDLRAAVTADLEDAIKNFGAAADAAKKAREAVEDRLKALQDKSQRDSGVDALRDLSAAYDENNYLVEKGHAQTALASLQSDTVRELTLRAAVGQQLANALKAAGVQMPVELASALATEQDVAAARAKTDATFGDAEKTLGDVADAQRNAPDFVATKNAGLLGLIGARYGHYVLSGNADLKKSLQGDVDKAKESQLDVPTAVKNLQ